MGVFPGANQPLAKRTEAASQATLKTRPTFKGRARAHVQEKGADFAFGLDDNMTAVSPRPPISLALTLTLTLTLILTLTLSQAPTYPETTLPL